ncbi:hypothetical protein B0H19DRAFT_1082534 [Mycena capillaripes]|nr:hypothetical protein B0H19DRAFT_1082534 [Mycena capillaripes]
MGYTDSAIWNYAMSIFSSTGFALLLYGIYISLFLLSLHILSRRRTSPGVKLLIAASCVMAVLATTQMAFNVAGAAINARLLQQTILSQIDPQLVRLYHALSAVQDLSFALNKSQLYRCYVIWGSQRKILILPALLIFSTLVVGILGSAPGSSIPDMRIPYSLAAATNLLLTAFTGKSNFLDLQLKRINMPSLTSFYRLESGAIYCVTAIFLMVTFSLNEDIYLNVIAIAEQLINIIPTFTLVYIGLTNTAENPLPDHVMRQVRSNQPLPSPLGPVQLSDLPQVLDITRQGIEEEDA